MKINTVDSGTLTVKTAEGEKQFKIFLADESEIIGESDEGAVSLWFDGSRLFISQGKLYEYRSIKVRPGKRLLMHSLYQEKQLWSEWCRISY